MITKRAKITRINAALYTVTILLSTVIFAWEPTERNDILTAEIDAGLMTEAMLKICSNNELAGELKSALLRFTDYFVETKEASRDDVTEILQYSQENVANLISRLELSLNEEECNNLAEGSKLRIAYYTEITTYNN